MHKWWSNFIKTVLPAPSAEAVSAPLLEHVQSLLADQNAMETARSIGSTVLRGWVGSLAMATRVSGSDATGTTCYPGSNSSSSEDDTTLNPHTWNWRSLKASQAFDTVALAAQVAYSRLRERVGLPSSDGPAAICNVEVHVLPPNSHSYEVS